MHISMTPVHLFFSGIKVLILRVLILSFRKSHNLPMMINKEVYRRTSKMRFQNKRYVPPFHALAVFVARRGSPNLA